MTDRFVIELEAAGGKRWQRVPAIVRLRRLLKASLRGYGLRCRRCERVDDQGEQGRVA